MIETIFFSTTLFTRIRQQANKLVKIAQNRIPSDFFRLYRTNVGNVSYISSIKAKLMKGTHLGEFEELVLLIVVILQEEAYVFKIREEILDQLDRAVSMGALHATLARLEKKGFLNSEMKGATKERGGRRKRVYQLTSSGKSAVTKVKEMRKMLWEQVPPIALNFNHG